MIRIPKLTSFAAFALSGLVLAQEPNATAPSGQPETKAAEHADKTAGKSAADHVRDLGSDSFKTRLQAEQALRAMGKDALPALRDGSKDGSDAEVQWRARRLIRQIERGETGGLDRRDDDAQAPQPQQPGVGARPRSGQGPTQGQVPTPFGGVRNRFDDLFRDLERDFGVDIPRGRFFQDDFFQDLQQQMDAMRAQMQQGGGASSQQSMSMQTGPDGVRVEIKQKNAKGEDESKVYEAPDLETFQQKYPGLLEQSGLHGGMRVFFGNGNGSGLATPFQFPQGGGWVLPQRGLRGTLRGGQAQPGQAQQNDDDNGMPPSDAMIPPPEGKRLGVVVRPQISDEVRQYLGLGADEGLQVEQVQDGTLAQKLGLTAGDIVTRIGGQKIGSTGDVQIALGAIEAGKPVEVAVLRRGKELTLKADKPAAPKGEAPKLEKRAAKDQDAGNEIR